MKKSLLCIILLIGLGSIFAQTGLFNLAFEMSRNESESVLKNQGFVVTERRDSDILYVNPNLPYITRIQLGFYEDHLLEWMIVYDKTQKDNLLRDVSASLQKLHGKNGWGSDEDAQLHWDLDYGNLMHLDWSKSSDYFEVFYTYDDEFFW
jgi:hypothetical protein